MPAERLGDGVDEAHAARSAVGEREGARGRLRSIVRRDQGEDGLDGRLDLGARHDPRRLPARAAVERHELDEAHDDVALACEGREVHGLVVVDAAERHAVDLDAAGEAGRPRRVEAIEHGVQGVATAESLEAVTA